MCIEKTPGDSLVDDVCMYSLYFGQVKACRLCKARGKDLLVFAPWVIMSVLNNDKCELINVNYENWSQS